MTTVNGSPTFSAGDRTTYLQDIASDLVAGIEVYKTRTPDQVEGSQTGVVNLTMRRPTDFKHGATYSLNLREDYATRSRSSIRTSARWSPTMPTAGIGKLGFTLNGTYNNVKWNEAIRYNALPALIFDPRVIVSPTTLPANTYIPPQVGFAGTNGWSQRAALSASAQWRPDDHWSITLEGGYNHQTMLWADHRFDIPVTYSASNVPPPSLSNVVFADDGRLVKSRVARQHRSVGPGRDSYQHKTVAFTAASRSSIAATVRV